jgi:hypothetical protein
MLSNFHHKIIGSTLHHISAYWELLHRAHNIADRDRRLATSFIAYRHRSNHIVLHRVLKIADRRFTSSIASPILQSFHHILTLTSPLWIYNVYFAIWEARCNLFSDPRYNISLMMRSLHFIAHVLIGNLPLQSPMQ